MSASNNTARGAMLLSVALLTGPAWAGMGQGGKTDAAVTDPGVAVAAQGTGTQMRCWQEGRLLFDARWIEAAPKIAPSALAMSGSGAGGAVQLLDLKSATCLIQPEQAGSGAD